ncbi:MULTISPECIES: cobalamin B12-binding domain-containing protein [Streptomyces]|uniref:Cobalamin B12-binding domain-containing protein n=1 Tax=Streptomyces xinghaiensis TaxID=1038928 RepID=A0A3R7EPZ2_9ACTN|nr:MULTISPECIES: cobalamin B12-binding domain-containing protein [Streptomyces]PQM21341.1 cobalamin-binding protein [Streptomyces xinghaiensis]RKM93708.1 cobalamin B12-binding domain-containing protein [Streptomyces xinghaiensis]RNC71487.1 cobalamin B12-binding domain-containing protein [Streptomyces xinghaiensis]
MTTTPRSPAAPPPSPAAGIPEPAGGPVAELLWRAVSAGDEYAATAAVLAALDAGADPESLLLESVAPVQARVGREWAANRMTVAQEHAATAINDRVVAAVAHHPASRGRPDRGRITVACVNGEWHALPARLLAEVLRLRGWRVDFLGAQVPAPHLIAHLHLTGPDAVALSSSIPTRLPTAHATITACQAAGTPVLAGGAAFGPDGRYARLLGADAWAADARSAAARLAEGPLAGGRAAPVRHPADRLPHLADQEYTHVTRDAPRLVRDTLAGLEARIPAMRGYTDAQRRHTAEDIAHIVDFLATALYTGDPRLFTGFLTWTGGILTARGVPAATLRPALDRLAGMLGDFPRALATLDEARRALDTAFPPAPAAPETTGPRPPRGRRPGS